MTKAVAKTKPSETFMDILGEDIGDAVTYVGLQLIILGPSGSGKSHLMGTHPGKILDLYGDTERHGVKSASKEGLDRLVSRNWSRDQRGVSRGANAAFKYLNDILEPSAIKAAGFDFVCLDSITDLLALIRGTTEWETRCMTDKGKHNSFAEGTAYIDMAWIILNKLINLQEYHNVDIAVIADLDITERAENGMIITSKPRMPSYQVAENIIRMFPDIVMMSRVRGKTETKPLIQMGAGCTRESKTQEGELVKTIDFTPRLSDVTTIPSVIKADLKELLRLKGR